MAVFFYPKSTITSQLFKLNGCRAGMRMDRGTFRENCVNLSGAEFRLKVCVHSPAEHLRLGCTAMWHTLARFLRLVGVNAAVYRVYYGAGNKRASLERYSCAPTFVDGRHATPTRLVTDWVCVTDVHPAEVSNCWMNINNNKSRKRHRQISNSSRVTICMHQSPIRGRRLYIQKTHGLDK